MSNCIIIFGKFNKKLLLPLILSLAQIILSLINEYYPEKENNIVLQIFTLSLGEMSIKLLPLILKIQIHNNIDPLALTRKKNRKCLHYFILCILFLLYQGIRTGSKVIESIYTDKDYSYTDSNLFPPNEFIIMSIEMIFLVLVSILLLKYKFYMHHVISIIIFIIFGIICDIVLNNYEKIEKITFIFMGVKILAGGVEATFYCYEKYMMERLFYPYWNVAFIPGVFMFAIGSVILILVLINTDKENSGTPFISTFYLYFQKENPGVIAGKAIMVFILHVIMCPLAILVVYNFGPSFILIVSQLSTITQNLITKPTKALYCLILYVVQIFALLIHLEVLELNFCGLNKSTKRNIDLRGAIDILFEGRDSTASKAQYDINKDYCISHYEKVEDNLEMNQQFDNNTIKGLYSD